MSKAPVNMIDIDLGEGFVLKGDLTEMLLIDLDNILDQTTKNAGWMGFVGRMLVRAKIKQREAEATKAQLYAALDASIRPRLSVGSKPPTETSVKREIENTPEYQAVELECLNLAAVSAELDNILSAFRDRTKGLSDSNALLRSTQTV